jgi:hypothetical protein
VEGCAAVPASPNHSALDRGLRGRTKAHQTTQPASSRKRSWQLANASPSTDAREPITSSMDISFQRAPPGLPALRSVAALRKRANVIASRDGGVRQQADVSLLGRATGRPREGAQRRKERVSAAPAISNQEDWICVSTHRSPPHHWEHSADFSTGNPGPGTIQKCARHEKWLRQPQDGGVRETLQPFFFFLLTVIT